MAGSNYPTNTVMCQTCVLAELSKSMSEQTPGNGFHPPDKMVTE